MNQRIVTSGNGYYVYECWSEDSMSDPYYEIHMAGEVVKRCDRLPEAEEYIHYDYEHQEQNYDR